MKKILLLLAFVVFSLQSYAVNRGMILHKLQDNSSVQLFKDQIQEIGVDGFLNLTPSSYEDLTGNTLSIAHTIQLKQAQSAVKSALPDEDGPIDKTIYIILAILGGGWIAMGILDDWKGKDWIISLILTALCWIPGVIYSFMKMKNYFPN